MKIQNEGKAGYTVKNTGRKSHHFQPVVFDVE